MYFFLVEITYLYIFGDVFLSRCTLQMKSHLVKMLNKVSLLLLLLLLLLFYQFGSAHFCGRWEFSKLFSEKFLWLSSSLTRNWDGEGFLFSPRFMSIHVQCESSECHEEATYLLDERKRSCLHFLQVCIKRCSFVVCYFSFECKIHVILCSCEKTNMFYMVRSKSLLSKVVACVTIVQTL